MMKSPTVGRKTDKKYSRLYIHKGPDTLIVGLRFNQRWGVAWLVSGFLCAAAMIFPGLDSLGLPFRSWMDVKAGWPLVSVTVGLLYLGFAGLKNWTDLTITAQGVKVRTGPLPWPGNLELSASKIKTFQVCKVHLPDGSDDISPRMGWRVEVVPKKGKPRKLFPDFPESEQQLVNRILGAILSFQTPIVSTQPSGSETPEPA